MQQDDKALIWDLPVRAFHWILAGSFAGAYLLAESERLRNFHVMFGYTVLGVVAFRMLWGFVGTRYARFASFAFRPAEVLAYLRSLPGSSRARFVGHNPAGSVAIWVILALAVLTGASGYLTFNEIGGDTLEEAHEVLANAWLLVVFAHVAGVLIESLLHHENLAGAMVTGYKRAESAAAIRGSAVAVGALVLTAALGFWSWTLAGGGPASAAGGEEGLQVQVAAVDLDDD